MGFLVCPFVNNNGCWRTDWINAGFSSSSSATIMFLISRLRPLASSSTVWAEKMPSQDDTDSPENWKGARKYLSGLEHPSSQQTQQNTRPMRFLLLHAAQRVSFRSKASSNDSPRRNLFRRPLFFPYLFCT